MLRWLAPATLIAFGLIPIAAQSPKIDLSEKTLVALASKYVAEYEKQFAFLIADEDYHQRQFDADGRLFQSRRLKSELFLTYLPADTEWIAVRDVMAVDEVPIQNREDLKVLLSRKDGLRGVAALVSERNSRYNIGRVQRTFNEPTLALLLLEEKRIPRIKFDRKEVTRDGDATLVTLSFEEKDRPTLVTERGGGAAPATGTVVIDAATGTVRGTVFRLRRQGVEVVLQTTYNKDDRLDLWLPSVFTERYESGGKLGRPRSAPPEMEAVHELVECEAKYSNYRRFDVSATIKK